jgi:hypothetical protein
MQKTADSSTKQGEFDIYLPGMPHVSAKAGRVERFLKRLLRQRGEYRVRISRRER